MCLKVQKKMSKWTSCLECVSKCFFKVKNEPSIQVMTVTTVKQRHCLRNYTYLHLQVSYSWKIIYLTNL